MSAVVYGVPVPPHPATAERQEDDMMVGAALMQNFLRNLPRSTFVIDPGTRKIVHDPQMANVCVDMPVFANRLGRKIRVESVEALQSLRERLVRAPLWMQADACRSSTNHYVVVRVTKHLKASFMLMVNTRHPFIRRQLDQGFELAYEKMLEGKKFDMKISLNTVIKQFYRDVLGEEGMYATFRCSGASLLIAGRPQAPSSGSGCKFFCGCNDVRVDLQGKVDLIEFSSPRVLLERLAGRLSQPVPPPMPPAQLMAPPPYSPSPQGYMQEAPPPYPGSPTTPNNPWANQQAYIDMSRISAVNSSQGNNTHTESDTAGLLE
ncbi:hypothetical protein Bbelb_113590 [Branchiostoma belcheri]|nr:hypothetical protein Bbelb_113590 [Branchiostoma belcheri]